MEFCYFEQEIETYSEMEDEYKMINGYQTEELMY